MNLNIQQGIFRFCVEARFLLFVLLCNGGAPTLSLASAAAEPEAAFGSLDTSFSADIGESGSVDAIQLLKDGRMLIGGEFTGSITCRGRGLLD